MAPFCNLFIERPSYFMRIHTKLPKIDVVTHGVGLVFRRSATPPPKGGGVPTLPNFWDSFVFAYTLCCRTTKIDVVTRVGQGRACWGQPRP